jgi:exopolysaccharide production protein ExoQ
MNPSLASLICACGIAGLFYLDRDKTTRISKALWLPTIWMALIGSRSVTVWLNLAPAGSNVEGSPIDAAVYAILSAAAIGVLIRRSNRTRVILAANWPVVIYFLYCLISVMWSYHPDVSLKRWTKAVGDLAMVLVIVTDRQPFASLRRLISRVGFVLLPASVLLIKYYDIGRGFTPDGAPMNTGVSTDKNMLGVMLLVISLGTLWHIAILFRAKHQPDRSRHLLAQSTLLVFGIALLKMANSQTSIACFVLGGAIIFATSLNTFRRRPARVHALCLSIILVVGFTLLLGGGADVVHAMGRKSNLSGRTVIWAAVIPAAPNSIVGAGFEDFWISPNVVKFQRALVGWWHPEDLNEAHNGYIEVYLNLGWVGVILIATLLIRGYAHAAKAFRMNPSVGGLILAYIVVAAVYSITEAGFRMLDLIWVFLLIAIVSASSVAASLIRGDALTLGMPDRMASRTAASNRINSGKSTVCTAAD